ncbi:MAG: TIGR02186 family protein [Rhodospirillaceae bacterium]|jgi:uncharacterized protein (TIGR02186 family)|nr:TIGR02186 family protein [Rhodospirillaceae bacterium]MBT5808953.1 TIGR02186 family protein [Rhodospirillaceae bacterium]
MRRRPRTLRSVAVALTVLVGLGAILGAGSSRAEPVIADVSEHFIGITADFTGAKILFFGSVGGPGKLVVVVSGPAHDISIGNKVQRAGIWMNSDSVTFKNAPSFYRVLSSEPLDEWLPLSVREANQIGVEYLDLQPTEDIGSAKEADYRAALIRNMQNKDHYGKAEGRLKILGGRLFRTDVFLPSNVPTGDYSIKTYLIRDGRIADMEVTPLNINKTGIGAEIYRVAHQHGALYGVAAIIIAVLAGLGGNAVFRKS